MAKHRILMAGPPGAGKTTVAHQLACAYPEPLPFRNLDSEISLLCTKHSISGRLPDWLIEEASDRLLSQCREEDEYIMELPHHDYIAMVQQERLQLASFTSIVFVSAPFHILRSRNTAREYHVPEEYILRCVGATHAFSTYLEDTDWPWVYCDSMILEPNQISTLIRDFTRRNESNTLSQLAIVPSPRRAYLGGHLLNEIEWDSGLVSALRSRYSISTVLDVGCGLGLSIDRFHDHGIEAWGIEGNPEILNGPCNTLHRIMLVDFTKQWVEWPRKPDLVWCVEVLEHIPSLYEGNILKTICNNAAKFAFVTAAAPSQPGYHHVNCQSREYWVSRFREYGFMLSRESDELLESLGDQGPFGVNYLKQNGMLFEKARS